MPSTQARAAPHSHRPLPAPTALVATLTALVTGACTGDGPGSAAGGEAGRWTPPPGIVANPATVPACVDTDRIEIPEPEEVASGLDVPWDLAFLPDGRILVVERRGVVRQIVDGELDSIPWATVPVEAVAEAGLLGIAVAPDFDRTGHVYLVGTFVDRSFPARLGRLASRLFGEGEGSAWKNRVLRLTEVGGRGTDPTVVVDGLTVGPIHAGGGLRFGPDGRLYVGIGDGGVPSRAADPSSPGGKIHVLDVEAGGAPTVHASGFRNPQRLAFHPATGTLVATDHGPSGLPAEGYRTGHDELDVVREGGDYGWPSVAGRWSGADGVAPIAEWSPAIAPGGVAFVDDTTSAWHGDIILSSLVQRRLIHLSMGYADSLPDEVPDSLSGGVPDEVRDSLSVKCQTNLYQARFGRIRAVHRGPDGYIHFTTSNRDQRGVPDERDDRLMRFRPPVGPPGDSR